MKVLYGLLLHLALPWVWARLYWKARLAPDYAKRIGERFGTVGRIPDGVVWFHTVSAGETNAAASTIRAVKERLPNKTFLVTTMTPTGSARVQALLGDIVEHCYAPYDYPWAVARFLRRVRPEALILMETELWPNLIERTAACGDVYLVNARLSERSFHRYRRVRSLTGAMLKHLSHVVCQYEDTAARFLDLGAPTATTIGSVKFDAQLPPDRFGVYDPGFGDAPVWIAGSTHPGEEEIVLDAHRRLLTRHPQMRLILVPRHPERAPAIQRLVAQYGFSVARLSARETSKQVLIGDVMGTLAHLYAFAHVAFIGGTLDDTGGHNPIEAAMHSVPILVGPARFKIEEVCARFLAAGCLHPVAHAADIERVIGDLIADEERRQAEGRRALAVVEDNRGAQQALVELLCSWLDGDNGARPKPVVVE